MVQPLLRQEPCEPSARLLHPPPDAPQVERFLARGTLPRWAAAKRTAVLRWLERDIQLRPLFSLGQQGMKDEGWRCPNWLAPRRRQWRLDISSASQRAGFDDLRQVSSQGQRTLGRTSTKLGTQWAVFRLKEASHAGQEQRNRTRDRSLRVRSGWPPARHRLTRSDEFGASGAMSKHVLYARAPSGPKGVDSRLMTRTMSEARSASTPAPKKAAV